MLRGRQVSVKTWSRLPVAKLSLTSLFSDTQLSEKHACVDKEVNNLRDKSASVLNWKQIFIPVSNRKIFERIQLQQEKFVDSSQEVFL